MTLSTVDDPILINQAIEMRQMGMLVSDIAKILSTESGKL